METPEILTETLALERIEVNTFRGVSPEDGPGRIFGGQVIAQSLLAAYETVEDRICHSLHCYFIRPGDPRIPILFEVDRSRDARWPAIIQAALVPLSIGLMAASGLIVAQTSDQSWIAVLITIVAATLAFATRINPLWMLLAGGLLGFAGVV